jgi:hypothetical protein
VNFRLKRGSNSAPARTIDKYNRGARTATITPGATAVGPAFYRARVGHPLQPVNTKNYLNVFKWVARL